MNEHASEHRFPLYEELAHIVGNKYVTEKEFDRYAYTRTPSWIQGKVPGIVVRPGNTQQVSEIMKLANRTKNPVIPRGGGASLGGFPVSDCTEKSILMDLTRMNKILFVDEKNMVVGAECGITLNDLSTEVEKKGLHIHTVDIPQYIDTLGGVLSGFNGGGCPSDYATTGELFHFLLGLEVVLPRGEILVTGSGPGTNIRQSHVVDRTPGSPDITGIFVGDAGVFGIKTKAYLKIYPRPERFVYGAFGFESFEAMTSVLLFLMTTGPLNYTRLVGIKPAWREAWALFYVINGSKEEVEFKEHKLRQICLSGGGEELVDELSKKVISSFSARQLGKSYASRGKFLYFEHLLRKTDAVDYFIRQKMFIDQGLKEAGVEDLITDRVRYLVPKERHMIMIGDLLFWDVTTLSPNQITILEKVSHDEAKYALENGAFLEQHQGAESKISASHWSEAYSAFMKDLKETMDPNHILNPGLWGL